MTDQLSAVPAHSGGHAAREVSLFAIGTALLRHRWTIAVLLVIGAVLGAAKALTEDTTYESTAIFIPQGAQSGTSGLAMAASQFGISLPNSGGAWGPSMYVALMQSRALLAPIALDTVTVVEEGNRRAVVMDLLKVGGSTVEQRATLTVGTLGRMIEAVEDKRLGAVAVTVTSKWPSVSKQLADRIVRRVNDFNLQTRQSQAAAERQFVDVQADESGKSLQAAEEALSSFLQHNRDITNSPALTFERDRLQREVTRQNLLYTSWLQNREEARIREIRDTPVITVLEVPRLPFIPVPKQVRLKAIIGAAAGVLVGFLIAFLSYGLATGRQASRTEAEEFYRLVEEVKPRFLKRRAS